MNTENDNHTIAQLVDRLQKGELAARESLIQISYERLKRLARRLLNDFSALRSFEETDDLLQRAAVRLWNALKNVELEDSKHFFNLAALQIRRELIDLSRSVRNIKSTIHSPYPQESNSAETPASREPFDPATETHEASHLASWTEFHSVVDQLDKDERETFELIWYQGLSQQSVADITGQSQATIARRWQKARRRVFELLGNQLPE